jgi:hypothetical protein
MMERNKRKTALDKRSIAAIADEIEVRLRDTSGTASPEVKGFKRESPTTTKSRRGSKKVFFWGAASGLAVAFAAPLLGKKGKPATRGAIKGGIAAGRYLRRVASTVKEDLQDLTAEARADLDLEKDLGKSPSGGIE